MIPKPDIQKLKAIQWLHPWEPFPEVQEQTRDGFTGYDLELVREVGPKHPLFPFKNLAVPIGVRCDCDDRLYWIPNERQPFVVVHITWAGTAQQWSADHPTAEFYASLDEWREQCMVEDHNVRLNSGTEE